MASSSPEADRDLLLEAGREAAEIALGFFRRRPAAWEKAGGAGPVSEADLAVDEALKARLAGARPGYGWLSEETPDAPERLDRPRIFVVDPIDGTRAFLKGEPGWCVALAVIEAGRPVAAAAVFPALGTSYAAALGAGAARDGAAIRPSARRDLEGASALAAKAQLDPERFAAPPPPMARSYQASMIHRLCLVAEGAADLMLTWRPVWEWDSAAGALIAAEAGCRVTDGAGSPLAYNAAHPRHEGLVAANPELHRAIVALRREPDPRRR